MKKFVITLSVLVFLIIATIAGASIAYSKTEDYKNDKFPENTAINGIDCSKLTYEQAIEKLTREWNKKHLVIKGKMDNDMATFTDFGCTYDIRDELKKAKKENLIFAAANHFISSQLRIQIPMKVDKYDEEFKKLVLASSFLNNEDDTVSRDAYVDLSKENFPIVPEVYGTKPNADKFFNDLLHHIQTGEVKFIFDAKDYYTLPKITSEDEELKEYQKFCRKYLKQKITYELGDETFTLTPEELQSLMKEGTSGNADEEAVNKYVSSMAKKYDNVGIERSFTSLSGRQIYVAGGTYGWSIDEKKEAAQLIKDINAHKSVSREPIFSQKGYGKYSRTIGDTYVDVDISNQRVLFYKKGELVFSSNCVTGCKATGTTTDTGAYYILNKVRDVVLKGDNADGSKYASPVKYWLGVTWTGQGFHDASWRSSFGGSIWINNGSHGCINMPPANMPALYNSVEVGTPVIMHY